MVGSVGSPPRAWGRPVRHRWSSFGGRFTPTCVGTASGCSSSSLVLRFTPTCVGTAADGPGDHALVPVHPHVRGDGGVIETVWKAIDGSPPRAWGRRIVNVRDFLFDRFTPTCVGTATDRLPESPHGTVHPHVRGDGATDNAAYCAVAGSPPRAWGRHEHARDVRSHRRFTPTCVGTAKSGRRSEPRCPVHPHVRGDGGFVYCPLDLAVGSPPRAWGRQALLFRCQHHGWFTPTCVGTAVRRGRSSRPTSVHPHVRGDGCLSRKMVWYRLGSPPRAWGRLVSPVFKRTLARFTPTCVGTAYWIEPCSIILAVHPHVRGDGVSTEGLP